MCYFSPFTPAHRIKDALGIAQVFVDGAEGNLASQTIRDIVHEEVQAVTKEMAQQQKSYADSLKTGLKEATESKTTTAVAKKVVVQLDADNIQRKKRETNIVIKDVPESECKDSEEAETLDFLTEVCEIAADDIDCTLRFKQGEI